MNELPKMSPNAQLRRLQLAEPKESVLSDLLQAEGPVINIKAKVRQIHLA